MNLLIDIGNTRLKWAVEKQGQLQTSTALVCASDDFQPQLKKAWQSLDTVKKLAISSVSSQKIVRLVQELAQQLWGNIKVIIATTQSYFGGVTNSYAQPEKLGVDRWLCLLATHHYYPQVGWVIDCGTAITVDYLDENGLHAGGLIGAGLQMMKKSLSINTTALEFSAEQHNFSLANNTQAAIYSGTLAASIGLIEQAFKMYPTQRGIVLTGGDAQIIQAHLSQTVILEADLVLKGLAIYLQQS